MLLFSLVNGNLLSYSRVVPPFPPFFFVDALILFAEASTDQINVIKQCLDQFCACSGQKASLRKSTIHFSCVVIPETARMISEMAGIPLSQILGKYLGTPIHGRISPVLYQPIIDRIASRLSGRKTAFFSFAGRVSLAKAVLTSIPIYIMQSSLLPIGVCNNIDKLVRRFIWEHTESRGGIHLLNWDTVTLNKDQGGLGIRSIRSMNLAMLAKLGWRLFRKEYSVDSSTGQ